MDAKTKLALLPQGRPFRRTDEAAHRLALKKRLDAATVGYLLRVIHGQAVSVRMLRPGSGKPHPIARERNLFFLERNFSTRLAGLGAIMGTAPGYLEQTTGTVGGVVFTNFPFYSYETSKLETPARGYSWLSKRQLAAQNRFANKWG